MTTEQDHPYNCDTHGGYREPAHECPGCVGEVRAWLKTLRDMAKATGNLDKLRPAELTAMFERMYMLLNNHITIEGKIHRPVPQRPKCGVCIDTGKIEDGTYCGCSAGRALERIEAPNR